MYQFHDVQYKDILNIPQLHIHAHCVTSIVGESGSGKTTLLRLLNKLISCDHGRITYNNTPLDEIDSIALRRKVVMLSQTPALFPGTIQDNLQIGLKFSEKPPADREELEKTLRLVHLNKAVEENADKLSGGEKQRLALGRVILMDPEIFLLDEPSSALDEDTEQVMIEQLVKHARSQGKSLIMVTHSKRVAQSFSDRIVELKSGRIAREEEV